MLDEIPLKSGRRSLLASLGDNDALRISITTRVKNRAGQRALTLVGREPCGSPGAKEAGVSTHRPTLESSHDDTRHFSDYSCF